MNLTAKAMDNAITEIDRLTANLNAAVAAAFNLEKQNVKLRAAASAVVHEYLSPNSIGSRVEYAIYELRDAREETK